ncbi:MAG: hypothetical protein HOE90_19660 [Bacteriovoracaceae bacterium]|jgi:hypothetical protein|nr:hypothetical protein [Bacteriovoracaceae bacterium]
MNKTTITVIFLILSTSAFALDVSVPKNCFNVKNYCSKSQVVRKGVKKYSRVELFSVLSEDDYDSEQVILDTYFAFSNWKKITRDKPNIGVHKSLSLKDQDSSKLQYVDFTIKAPFPVMKLKIKMVIDYKKNLKDTESSVFHFNGLINKSHTIPGVGVLRKAVGVVEFSGLISVKYLEDDGEYLVYLIFNSIPELNILPGLTAPYLERAMLDLYKGLFEI